MDSEFKKKEQEYRNIQDSRYEDELDRAQERASMEEDLVELFYEQFRVLVKSKDKFPTDFDEFVSDMIDTIDDLWSNYCD